MRAPAAVMRYGFLVGIVGLLFGPRDAAAELTLARVFSDHMVVQRERPIRVWGWASSADVVTVRFAGQSAEVFPAGDGGWAVELEPLAASASGQTLEVCSGDRQLVIRDVLVGDVWHASGQSNMAMTVKAACDALPEIEAVAAMSDLPAVRFCRIHAGASREPLADLPSEVRWQVCTPRTAPGFSAAAFFFAQRLHQSLDVPIGVVDSSRGGTPIEPFIPRAAFVGHPTLVRERELGDRDDLDGLSRMPGGVRARDDNWLPGRLYHSRLAPIERMPVRGCIWYQGESNCGVGEDPRDYASKMRALVCGWRQAMGRDDLPFFYVQLPGSGAGAGWPSLREQQRLAADLEGVGMVVTVDLEGEGIHPPNKVDVGRRLAAWALAEVSDRDVPHGGPLVRDQEVRGSSLVIRFHHAESGLMTATKKGLSPPQETPDAQPRLFEVADREGCWHPATARIEGTTVIVASDAVARPVAARYAYAVAPDACNLYNRDGLPASPFCTDPALVPYDPQLPE